MEYYNGKLCVTYDDLAGIATMNAIQCIVKKDASIQARKACRSNPALFDLDRLPLKFQLEVYRRRPDLKAQAESKPFVESWKIQCKLPPKTKRFCPLVLK